MEWQGGLEGRRMLSQIYLNKGGGHNHLDPVEILHKGWKGKGNAFEV